MEKLCENLPPQSAVALKNKQWKFINDAQKQDWDAEKKFEKDADAGKKSDEAPGGEPNTDPASALEPETLPSRTGFEKVLVPNLYDPSLPFFWPQRFS